MGKKRRLFIIALFIPVAGVATLLLIGSGPQNPFYQGKRLSFWLRQDLRLPSSLGSYRQLILSKNGTNLVVFYNGMTGPDRTNAYYVANVQTNAATGTLPEHILVWTRISMLPHVDSNAVPYLLKVLKVGNGPFHNAYVAIYSKLPAWLQDRLNPPVDAKIIRGNAAILLSDFGRDDTIANRAAGSSNYHKTMIVTALLEAKKDPLIGRPAERALWLCDPEVAIQGSIK